jgi:hypothetical protein
MADAEAQTLESIRELKYYRQKLFLPADSV